MKINITMNDELLERVDTYVKEQYMTRSGFISFACVQYLNQLEMFKLFKQMTLTLKKIEQMGTLDEQTMKELEDFERIGKMLMQQ